MTNRLMIKICGLTREEDVDWIAKTAVWGIGFVLWEKSSRFVSWEQLARFIHVVKQNNSRVKTVGVFVNPKRSQVLQGLDCGLSTIQFHGEESVEFCDSFNCDYIKVARPQNIEDIEVLGAYEGASYFLIDAFAHNQYGGTGRKVQDHFYESIKSLSKPTFIAGGISSDNVAAIVRKLNPDGIDLSSGVESQPGIKSKEDITNLFGVLKNLL